jgi:hypothetical protein
MSNLKTNYFSSDEKKAFNGRIEQEVIKKGYSSDFGKLVAAQANYESGYFSNPAFIQFNNICGYKYDSGSPYQIGKGNTSTEGDPYAHYNYIEDSVDELIAWFERRQKKGFFNISDIKTPKDYVNALTADPKHQWFSNGNNPPTQKQIDDYILGMSTLAQKIGYIYSENSAVINGTALSILGVWGFIYLYVKYVKK